MRWTLRTIVAVLSVCLPLSTAARVRVWGDEQRVWSEAVAHSPDKPRPWINLGAQWARVGADDLAAYAYQQAADLGMRPARARLDGPMRVRHVALLNLAIVRAGQGRHDEALQLTADIQPRAVGRDSLVNRLETQWRDEQRHGGPSQAF